MKTTPAQRAFAQAIIEKPINFVSYDGCGIQFYTWPENIDYLVDAYPPQLREFCEATDPNEIRTLDKWLFHEGRGFAVPEVVIEYITHSRHEWKQIVEVENQN